MKIIIEYYYKKKDHDYSLLDYSNREYISYRDIKSLDKYITCQMDPFGYKFKKTLRPKGLIVCTAFNYTSKCGAVKIILFKPIKFKQI